MSLNESIVEDAAFGWFLLRPGYGGRVGDLPSPSLLPTELGFAVGHLPSVERDSYGEVVLEGRLREAIRRQYLAIPQSRTLATLRDPACAGLPKLLSGELSVSESQPIATSH